MWELDYKESWAPKNWCFWTVVLEKALENLLDCKEIKPVHPKANQSWIFIGGLTLWCWETLKAGGEGDDRGWDGWMALLLDGREFEQTLGDSEGQGSLVCCSPWGPVSQAWLSDWITTTPKSLLKEVYEDDTSTIPTNWGLSTTLLRKSETSELCLVRCLQFLAILAIR